MCTSTLHLHSWGYLFHISSYSQLALCNALRYFPSHLHQLLAAEFAQELRDYGHIYMYRFRPVVEMRAYPISDYPAKCRQAAAIMHMIMNNLDPRVAQVNNKCTIIIIRTVIALNGFNSCLS